MQKTHEIFPAGAETVDVVKEKEALYASLMMSRGQEITSAYYLYILMSGVRCGFIDDKTYDFFAGFGIVEQVPYELMAMNLHNRLLEDLEKDFAEREADHAGAKDAPQTANEASDRDDNGIAECVRDAVMKAED